MEILGLALFSVWITGWFTPFNPAREWITDKWIRLCIKLNLHSLASLAVVISCSKCFGFWFTLLYSRDFILALNVSFVAFLITFGIEQIEQIKSKWE